MSEDALEGVDWEDFQRCVKTRRYSKIPSRKRVESDIAVMPSKKATCYGYYPGTECGSMLLINCKKCGMLLKHVGYAHHMLSKHPDRGKAKTLPGNEFQSFLLSPPHGYRSPHLSDLFVPFAACHVEQRRSSVDERDGLVSRTISPIYSVEHRDDLKLSLRASKSEAAIDAVAKMSSSSDLSAKVRVRTEAFLSNGRIKAKKRKRKRDSSEEDDFSLEYFRKKRTSNKDALGNNIPSDAFQAEASDAGTNICKTSLEIPEQPTTSQRSFVASAELVEDRGTKDGMESAKMFLEASEPVEESLLLHQQLGIITETTTADVILEDGSGEEWNSYPKLKSEDNMLHEGWNVDLMGTSSLALNDVTVGSGYIPSPPQLSPAVGKDPYIESVLNENEFTTSIHDDFYGDQMGLSSHDRFDLHPYNDGTTDFSQKIPIGGDLIENGNDNISYVTLEDAAGTNVLPYSISAGNIPVAFVRVDEQLPNNEYGTSIDRNDVGELELHEKIYTDSRSDDHLCDNNQQSALLTQNRVFHDPYGNIYQNVDEHISAYQLQEKQVAINNGCCLQYPFGQNVVEERRQDIDLRRQDLDLRRQDMDLRQPETRVYESNSRVHHLPPVQQKIVPRIRRHGQGSFIPASHHRSRTSCSPAFPDAYATPGVAVRDVYCTDPSTSVRKAFPLESSYTHSSPPDMSFGEQLTDVQELPDDVDVDRYGSPPQLVPPQPPVHKSINNASGYNRLAHEMPSNAALLSDGHRYKQLHCVETADRNVCAARVPSKNVQLHSSAVRTHADSSVLNRFDPRAVYHRKLLNKASRRIYRTVHQRTGMQQPSTSGVTSAEMYAQAHSARSRSTQHPAELRCVYVHSNTPSLSGEFDHVYNRQTRRYENDGRTNNRLMRRSENDCCEIVTQQINAANGRYLGMPTRTNFQKWSALDSSGVQQQPDPLRMTSKANCHDVYGDPKLHSVNNVSPIKGQHYTASKRQNNACQNMIFTESRRSSVHRVKNLGRNEHFNESDTLPTRVINAGVGRAASGATLECRNSGTPGITVQAHGHSMVGNSRSSGRTMSVFPVYSKFSGYDIGYQHGAYGNRVSASVSNSSLINLPQYAAHPRQF